MSIEIVVPDIGDDKFPVIEILASQGDAVEEEQGIALLESDKATMEIPSPASGRIVKLTIKSGDTLGSGDVIGLLAAASVASDNSSEKSNEEKISEPEKKMTGSESSPISIIIPDIGDDKFPIIEILIAQGGSVSEEQGIVLLESDKATMEVPASASGTVATLTVSTGDMVGSGDVIGTLTVERSPANNLGADDDSDKILAEKQDMPVSQSSVTKAAPAQKTQPANNQAINHQAFKEAHASPSVRKFARELGVDLGSIKGSGKNGRITEVDIKSFIKSALSGQTTMSGGGSGIPTVPTQNFSQFGTVEEHKLSRINVLTGEHMTRCWLNVPHVTQFDEADITELEIFRKSLKSEAEKLGVRVTLLSFLMKAMVVGLKAFPKFNSSLSEDKQSLIMKKYYNVGIAVDTPNGLVVPVIKDVDKKSIYELSSDLMAMSEKARVGKLTPSDMSGGSMTISSLGGIGGTAFTPIVNSPEVAILGVSRSQIKPVWNGSDFEPKNILPMSLSYDHRVIDGADGARFTQLLSAMLSDARRLLL